LKIKLTAASAHCTCKQLLLRVTAALGKQRGKWMLIGAPYTSNCGLLYSLMVAFVLCLNVHWMGKSGIFKPPFRGLI
jgi:hypothetical protein